MHSLHWRHCSYHVGAPLARWKAVNLPATVISSSAEKAESSAPERPAVTSDASRVYVAMVIKKKQETRFVERTILPVTWFSTASLFKRSPSKVIGAVTKGNALWRENFSVLDRLLRKRRIGDSQFSLVFRRVAFWNWRRLSGRETSIMSSWSRNNLPLCIRGKLHTCMGERAFVFLFYHHPTRACSLCRLEGAKIKRREKQGGDADGAK